MPHNTCSCGGSIQGQGRGQRCVHGAKAGVPLTQGFQTILHVQPNDSHKLLVNAEASPHVHPRRPSLPAGTARMLNNRSLPSSDRSWKSSVDDLHHSFSVAGPGGESPFAGTAPQGAAPALRIQPASAERLGRSGLVSMCRHLPRCPRWRCPPCAPTHGAALWCCVRPVRPAKLCRPRRCSSCCRMACTTSMSGVARNSCNGPACWAGAAHRNAFACTPSSARKPQRSARLRLLSMRPLLPCRTSEEFVSGHVPGAAANVPFKLPAGNGTLVPNPAFVAQARMALGGCHAADAPAAAQVVLGNRPGATKQPSF